MSVEKKVRGYLDEIKKRDGEIKAFLYVNEKALEEAREIDKKKDKGKLAGYVVAVKANINVKGMPCNCASKTLEGYKATYDATVIERIKKEDGIIIGIVNCDEFACGSSGETSAFMVTDNPLVPGFVPGGSSSGSAAAVAAGFCDVALGSDTGGSIRVPASFCGVVGVKPSYGAVSRYGLVDLSMSLDQIGPLARTVEEARDVFEFIHGKDERDTSTFEKLKLQETPEKLTFGVVSVSGVSKEVEKVMKEFISKMEKKGWKKKEIELKNIDLAVQTYHPLVWTEFFSATRRFDGRKYGRKIEDYCGPEVLRRILGGSEISKAEMKGQYYQKALAVKEVIKKEFEEALGKVDFLVMPTVAVLPWKLGAKITPEEMYAVDALAIPSNLAEVCAISIPAGKAGKFSVGMQIICGKGEEERMFSLAERLEVR